jgi:hypothetical protein
LQSAKPEAHAPIEQLPPAHVAAAFGKLQPAPQVPQFATEVWVLVSQPLVATPSQSAKPARHTEQVPSLPHPRLSAAGQSASEQHARHADPQQMVPPPQSVWLHVPPAHRSLLHGLPEAHCESLQQAAHTPPPQSRSPPVHTQWPDTHACPAPHAVPHAPQLFTSLVVSTSQPSEAMALQSANPVSHVNPHAPIAHVAVPCATVEQTAPQPPQFETLACVSTQPPPQLAIPDGHAMVHPVPPHTGMAAGQTTPQAPQLFGSLVGVEQSLLPAVHSRKPGVHAHAEAWQTAFDPHP